MKRSKKMMKGIYCDYFILVIVNTLIYLRGLLMLLIGSIFAAAFLHVMLADFYVINKKRIEQRVEPDSDANF